MAWIFPMTKCVAWPKNGRLRLRFMLMSRLPIVICSICFGLVLLKNTKIRYRRVPVRSTNRSAKSGRWWNSWCGRGRETTWYKCSINWLQYHWKDIEKACQSIYPWCLSCKCKIAEEVQVWIGKTQFHGESSSSGKATEDEIGSKVEQVDRDEPSIQESVWYLI